MGVSAEIKVNVDGDATQTLSALGDLGATPALCRRVWFAEDCAGVPSGELRLLSAGVVVRIRTGDAQDDSTVKLRPCHPGQLHGRWRAGFGHRRFEYRVEGDWSGDRHVLAASAVAMYSQGELAAAVGGPVLPSTALSDDQRRLARHCAGVRLTAAALVPLGPVTSTRWSDVALDGLRVNVERWTLEELDFVEISVRVKPKHDEPQRDFTERAVRTQAELLAAVNGAGLRSSDDGESKTRRVLSALVARRKLSAGSAQVR